MSRTQLSAAMRGGLFLGAVIGGCASADTRPRVALVEFEDRTEIGRGRLATFAAEAVRAGLSGARALRVVEPRSVGAHYLVSGAVSSFGYEGEHAVAEVVVRVVRVETTEVVCLKKGEGRTAARPVLAEGRPLLDEEVARRCIEAAVAQVLAGVVDAVR